VLVSIENWNIRLKKHFDGLYQNVCNGKHRPIFILEHGLSSEEIHALQIDIREFISKRSPSSEDMLPWVVYATEIGYKFEGYEFWQTFENLTPGWQSKGDRNWIRSCFRKFNYIYEGANPAGLWAGKFTIICWPITHAILPIDLQRHLARILFDLRYQFSVEMFDDPNLLGGMIAERAWSANSRFQEFAQNSLLVGQIATALLVQGQDGYNSLILPSTLERIKRDLDNVRTARDWLKTASQHAQKVRLQGITRGRIGITPDPTLTVVGVKQLKELAIEPHLILQPVDINSWRVLLEMPDLSPLMNHFPQLKPSLLDSRCRVTGSSERWLARGWLLHGTQTITLQEWPESDEVLLTFENSTPLLDFILQGECLLKPGSILLFKIGSDTKGYQIDSLALRPGRKYIIVTISGLPHEKWLIPITLDCTGANAAILDMPDIIPPELEQFVTSIGLHLAKTILVEPAGLTASRWDGEGSAEWISSEQPGSVTYSV